MRLENKTALITGAAGQLGCKLIEAFVSEGANVWLADCSSSGVLIASRLVPSEQLLGTLVFDVTDQLAVKNAFLSIYQEGGSLDILVNNAGIGVFTSFWDRNYEDFLKVMSVNAGGTFLCTREALLLMKQVGQGSVVNIGSIYGLISSDPRIYTDSPRINSEAYSASKAAVIQLTKYFAVHAATFGIRVNCVSPGGIFNNQGSDFVRNYSYRTPMTRMATAVEVCGAVTFLASSEASYITGQNIIVDGGYTAW